MGKGHLWEKLMISQLKVLEWVICTAYGCNELKMIVISLQIDVLGCKCEICCYATKSHGQPKLTAHMNPNL